MNITGEMQGGRIAASKKGKETIHQGKEDKNQSN